MTTRARLPCRSRICGSPPRGWGRLSIFLNSSQLHSGSPPRVWGRHEQTIDDCVSNGGSPSRLWGRLFPSKRNLMVAIGSPPRLWGRRRDPRSSPRRQSVHPHACGDDFLPPREPQPAGRFTPTPVWTTSESVARLAISSGSPPRLWGRRALLRAARPPRPVHPHACGDDATFDPVSRVLFGSPPRLWGRHTLARLLNLGLHGSPPRLWGRRNRAESIQIRATVHPHACGDDDFASPSFITPPPVHPHACGDDGRARVRVGLSGRFTPTPVGTTR